MKQEATTPVLEDVSSTDMIAYSESLRNSDPEIRERRTNICNNTPLRCVPIVSGTDVRASAIFYRASDGDTYLATAAHNVVPFECPRGTYETTFHHATIDLFLPTEMGWESKWIDIRDNSLRVSHSRGIDILAVSIPFGLDESQVHVWTEDQLVDPLNATGSVEVTGYPKECFPDEDETYFIETYADGISVPASLNMKNSVELRSNDILDQKPLLEFGLDDSTRVEYRGFSGAPVTTTSTDGNPKLVGMQVTGDEGQLVGTGQSQTKKTSTTACCLSYYPSKIVPQLIRRF